MRPDYWCYIIYDGRAAGGDSDEASVYESFTLGKGNRNDREAMKRLLLRYDDGELFVCHVINECAEGEEWIPRRPE